MTTIDWTTYVKHYNDIKAYPTLRDVAVALGVSRKTVKNRAAMVRALKRQGEPVPDLIDRSKIAGKDHIAPKDHAKIRAVSLAGAIHDLLVKSRYPVINPQAIRVESHVARIYDRRAKDYVDVEGVPRTWITDTLKVAPIADVRGRRFLFTGAQNDAPVHQGFWRNLQAYAAHVGANIVVGPWTYETQWWSENNPTSRAYAEEIQDHLCFGQMKLGSNFVFCGEMNTLPTAHRPISDLLTYSRGRWAVFPHAKLQLKSVPSTDPSQQAHQVMTTGAVTLPKVIARKAGVKSIFHHVIGATIVEFDQVGDVFCRQINAEESGAFYDLDAYVVDGQVSLGHRVRAVVCGDIHARKLDRDNAKAMFGFDPKTGHANSSSMLEALQPELVLLHDLHDNEARNHHHVHDNAYSYEMAVRGRESVLDEIKVAAQFLADLSDLVDGKVKVIESNHDLALERYVREGRYRNDGINIRLGLQLEDAYLAAREEQAAALEMGVRPETFSLLEHAIRQVEPELEKVSWVHDGQSFLIDGVECGHHGFRGANGARGNVAGFAQAGRKMSIGDKHSPEIMDGVYVAGVMTLQMGYNRGPSGWCVSQIVQYPNGKRTLVTFQSGKWRG